MTRRAASLAALALWAAIPAAAAQGVLERSGYAEALLGRWESALWRLKGLDPASTYFRGQALLELGVEDEGEALLTSLVGTPSSFAGPAFELVAARRFVAGNYAGVVSLADAAGSARLQDPHALSYFLGQSRWLEGDRAGAAADLARVAAGPYRPYALHALGALHFLEGSPRRAVEHLGAAVEAAAEDGRRGAALVDRIRLTLGRVLYQSALAQASLAPDDRRALLRLAREEFRTVRAESPFYAEALRGEAWCSVELEDAARALTAFGEASVRDPAGRHEDLWGQGRTYQRAALPDEAARLYGEAHTEAVARAESLAGRSGPAPPWTDPAWARARRRAQAVRERLLSTQSLAEEVAEACDRREARYRDVEARYRNLEARVETLRERVLAMAAGPAHTLVGCLRCPTARRADGIALAEGLEHVRGHIQEYLDRVSSARFLPRRERLRIDTALDHHERLGADIIRLEADLASPALGAGVPEAARARVDELRARLEEVRVRLLRAAIAFLAAVQELVSERESELVRRLEGLRRAVDALGGPLETALDRLAEARSLVGTVRERLEALLAQAEAVSVRLEKVERGAALAERASAGEALDKESAQLRLRADQYALDETQSLHLWRATEDRGR